MADQITHLVRFDAAKARAFKRCYDYAVRNDREQFIFEGADYLTSYARYVCEYLTMKGLLP